MVPEETWLKAVAGRKRNPTGSHSFFGRLNGGMLSNNNIEPSVEYMIL
jgi:hypothetical protein